MERGKQNQKERREPERTADIGMPTVLYPCRFCLQFPLIAPILVIYYGKECNIYYIYHVLYICITYTDTVSSTPVNADSEYIHFIGDNCAPKVC